AQCTALDQKTKTVWLYNRIACVYNFFNGLARSGFCLPPAQGIFHGNELSQQPQGLGVQLIQLIEINDARVPEQLKYIKQAITESAPETQSDWLELLETILVYKLPRLSRDEVKKMLSDILNVELKQTRFYQDVFAEGLLEGKQEGEVILLSRLLKRRFGTVNAVILKRLKNATPQQLELWADNILDAASIEDVFIER
ncbi:MAG: DUF2887 domain-containing protein, partial [Methylococcaceae bacterium]|nr:DUF2887 domain-containing protein [Methylococcaceae bacterium]